MKYSTIIKKIIIHTINEDITVIDDKDMDDKELCNYFNIDLDKVKSIEVIDAG